MSSRLSKEEYSNNFSDAYPGFTDYEAKVEADRCYFTDARISACPTEINIPYLSVKFLQKWKKKLP